MKPINAFRDDLTFSSNLFTSPSSTHIFVRLYLLISLTWKSIKPNSIKNSGRAHTQSSLQMDHHHLFGDDLRRFTRMNKLQRNSHCHFQLQKRSGQNVLWLLERELFRFLAVRRPEIKKERFKVSGRV